MILVLSDSHVPNRAPEIPPEFLEKAEKADRLIQCGDFETREVYESLEDLGGETIAVRGNCDRFELPNSEVFSLGDIRFGVYHGSGINPRGDHETLLDIARNKLGVDVLFHGHTHQEEIFREEGTILLNPGSCTGVGGGSSNRSDPTVMEVEYEEVLEASILGLRNGSVIKKESRSFDI